MVVVGCKTDAINDDHDDEKTQVNRAMAMSMIENAMQCQCSSKTGANVNGVFMACAERILEKRKGGDVSCEGEATTGSVTGETLSDHEEEKDTVPHEIHTKSKGNMPVNTPNKMFSATFL